MVHNLLKKEKFMLPIGRAAACFPFRFETFNSVFVYTIRNRINIHAMHFTRARDVNTTKTPAVHALCYDSILCVCFGAFRSGYNHLLCSTQVQ